MARLAAAPILCAILFGVGSRADEDYKDDSKACNELFPKPVNTFCHEKFPGKESPKLWIVLFTSHACYHCNLVKRGFVELARELQDNPGVAVGAVNCYWSANYHSLCLGRQVDALPSLRIIQNGVHNITDKGVPGQYPRHSPEDVHRLVKAALEQQPACPKAAAHIDDKAIVPLCADRFPSEGNVDVTWLVVFYSQASLSVNKLLDAAKVVSFHLGNAASLSDGVKWKRMKKSDRLLAIRKEYGLRLAMPAQGPFGYASFAKVGGVCCDCDAKQEAFCTSALGGGEALTLPLAAWIVNGQQVAVEAIEETRPALMEFALSRLGFLADGEGEL